MMALKDIQYQVYLYRFDIWDVLSNEKTCAEREKDVNYR
jgi:hypothetical protein